METDRSRRALMVFLEYMGTKGLSPQNTVSARKAAVNQVLGILNDEEARDITEINLSDVMARFGNLKGKEYTPDSLRTYQSRVKAAIDDFKSYLQNPLAFRPTSQLRERQAKPVSPTRREDRSDTNSDLARRESPLTAPAADTIFPIPIRADVTVYIQGLPFDLTKAEANKIAAVIQAFANS